MKYAMLLALLTSGCAHRRHVETGAPHLLKGCHEVSVNYKTEEITVICPMNPEATK